MGMKAIPRNARHCAEATNVGFAQNSHRCATVRPRAGGARVGQPSLTGWFRSAAVGRSWVLCSIGKSGDGARAQCKKARRLRAKTHQSSTPRNHRAARNAVRSGT
jgi:hypothetical protein